MRYPIMLTDGFGSMPMNSAAYRLLTTNAKREATGQCGIILIDIVERARGDHSSAGFIRTGSASGSRDVCNGADGAIAPSARGWHDRHDHNFASRLEHIAERLYARGRRYQTGERRASACPSDKFGSCGIIGIHITRGENTMYEGDQNNPEVQPPEESSNRTFLIVAGLLAGVVLLSLACLAGVYFLGFVPNRSSANSTSRGTSHTECTSATSLDRHREVANAPALQLRPRRQRIHRYWLR